jgi:hypothetical protein
MSSQRGGDPDFDQADRAHAQDRWVWAGQVNAEFERLGVASSFRADPGREGDLDLLPIFFVVAGRADVMPGWRLPSDGLLEALRGLGSPSTREVIEGVLARLSPPQMDLTDWRPW